MMTTKRWTVVDSGALAIMCSLAEHIFKLPNGTGGTVGLIAVVLLYVFGYGSRA